MVDSVTLMVLGDQKELYGRQKVGCPIGFGIAVFLTGFFMEELDTSYALFGVFAACAIGCIMTIALLDFTPYRASLNATEEGRRSELELRKPSGSMWEILRSGEVLQFLTVIILLGFSVNVILAFLFLFIRDNLGATPALIGLLGPLGSTTEIFRSLGTHRMLTVAQLITLYRCLAYIASMEFENGAWLAVVTQLMHGAAFSLIWSAAVVHIDTIASPEWRSSAQGLLNMTFNGIGAGLGSTLGGYVYEAYGAKTMWSLTAVIMVICLFIHTTSVAKRFFLLLAKCFQYGYSPL
ncbi:hypothetical protein DFQ28_003238 [Apophysomyces sp. BC1034]|nr:hypothetical protein DFQ28_003238 [Apophysomyces sp. BC1034]